MNKNVNFKKIIKQKIEPLVLEKGFEVDKNASKYANGYVNVKFYDEITGNGVIPNGLKETILIYRNRWYPEICAKLRSELKQEYYDLATPAGNDRFWWPVRTEGEAEESVETIKQLIEKYAWDWFAKRDPEEDEI